ncbi:MAG: 3-methyl-2-oxobutanoate hydroxymethyltransferase [Gammaproteobacteria bacterium RBG_16_51_14]|nr:MAG: 3-methyl-2-oxobutanoate hydroxymethyltransferase [Gammaproteobacteria bacterium RBG_16_51_14]
MKDKVTIIRLQEMKQAREKIASLTAYDAGFARILDEAGVDILLVGDSLGMVLHGDETTLRVRMVDMIYHTRLVKAGTRRAMIIGDMPFMSYTTPAQALGNAARLMSEGGAELVKLEGGRSQVETVSHLVNQGIPVCAHLGLTPQSIHKFGGYRVQGRDDASAAQIRTDAKALRDAGAALLVLECVPHLLAAEITAGLDIPVIGIGAGADCDGQVLVLYDMLGISGRQPRFSRNYLENAQSIRVAVKNYVDDVKAGRFPAAEHQFE